MVILTTATVVVVTTAVVVLTTDCGYYDPLQISRRWSRRSKIRFREEYLLSTRGHRGLWTTSDLSTIGSGSAPFRALRAPTALAEALRARCVGASPQLPFIQRGQSKGAISQTNLKPVNAPKGASRPARRRRGGVVWAEGYASSVARSGKPRLNMRSSHERVDSFSIVLLAASSWR